jgi:putative serine protease PepD
MKGAQQVLVITAAAVAGAGISAAVVEQSFAPGRDTVRTVIRPVDVASGNNASALKTTGMSVNQVFKAASPAVVKIVATQADGQAQGSGFEIDHSGNIVTNDHVVAGATSIRVVTRPAGRTSPNWWEPIPPPTSQ